MKKIVALFVIFAALPLHAQLEEEIDISQLQNGIDRSVWKPFKQAFETLDAKALNAIYAEDVIRVTPDGIDTENEFKRKNIERFEESENKDISISLDFWFDSRHTNITTSYEVGFYRIISTDKANKKTYNYGQFHIVIKHTELGWKIVQDWDTATINGVPIGAEDFAKQEPLRF